MKIRRDDTVEITAGKDKGKQGKVRRGLPAEEKVIVADLNISKKHVKRGDPKRRAGIIDVEMPIHVSNVMLVCPECNAKTRVGYRFLENGNKVRYCKECNEVIPERGVAKS
ncbi:MAG: 50S ribosomal protein L24 [Chloroflexota bacterium]